MLRNARVSTLPPSLWCKKPGAYVLVTPWMPALPARVAGLATPLGVGAFAVVLDKLLAGNFGLPSCWAPTDCSQD